ncbi:hypothetical protein SRB5_43930 [Streptomyces sp. RB5]|uniref:Histidine kinase/HSP90-like ATPase domain-containing protein n=2 Tax=Streptomyces smaragdinus TaxID=2585196 RepID=A0A7K0CLD8_9ACTN|nr:hypothetical protein [Streptomyces smaragdinus]
MPHQLALATTADPVHLAFLRRTIKHQLAGWGLDDLTSDAMTVSGELLANAMEHAGGNIYARFTVRPSQLLIEVLDGSSDVPRIRPIASWSERGRGLSVVQALSAEWGYWRTPTGKTVWAVLTNPPPASPDAGIGSSEAA